MRRIPLTQGLFAIVDDEDYEHLNQWKWSATKAKDTFYAVRCVYLGGGKKNTIQRHIYMHREIVKAPRVDHRDRDGLNNRRENLRAATGSQNIANAKLSRKNTSGFKGVSQSKGRWRACIKVDYRQIRLGTFDTPEQAAQAYRAAALQHFGEFARADG